jgi:divalent metal cation (Fe/Co/Zn/Cd) transporter
MQQPSLRLYMYLSIAAAVVTMAVKFIGYLLTGSVGLFSDAAESVVNLVAALVGLWALTPPPFSLVRSFDTLAPLCYDRL